MDVSLSLHGVDALLDAFAKAPAVVSRNMRVAVKEGASMVQREARKTHRFQSRRGTLERAVEVAHVGRTSGASATVFLNEAVAKYAAPIHDGSRPHVIMPRVKRALRFPVGGGFQFAPLVHHPGTKRDEFLYRAAELMGPAVEMRIQQGVDESIQEVGLQ